VIGELTLVLAADVIVSDGYAVGKAADKSVKAPAVHREHGLGDIDGRLCAGQQLLEHSHVQALLIQHAALTCVEDMTLLLGKGVVDVILI
jgi:hypothetical protein